MNNLVCSIASYLVNSVWEVALIGTAGWAVSRLVEETGSAGGACVVGGDAGTRGGDACAASLAMAGERDVYFYRYERISFDCLCCGGWGKSNAAHVALLSPVVIYALSACYVIALLYFAVRLFWSLYLTVRLVREAEPISLRVEKEDAWRRCQRVLSTRDAQVLGSGQIAGPVTVAFGKPVLLLPVGFAEECSEVDFLAAVAHECVHMQRDDFWKNLFYEMASLLVAFHPVTWMVKSRIAQTREMICDATATEKLIESHTYAQSLLRLATMASFGSRVAPSLRNRRSDADILEELSSG